MKALIFNGALDRRPHSTAHRITEYLTERLKIHGVDTAAFHVADSGVPLFDASLNKIPRAVEVLNHRFRAAQLHLWLTPLYHGSMTGVMKNCLDWLECSSKLPSPYLTGHRVGLVCWADGVQAMQGVNAMDSVAKALRAWTLPYSVAIQKKDLFQEQGAIAIAYRERLDRIVDLLVEGTPGIISQSTLDDDANPMDTNT